MSRANRRTGGIERSSVTKKVPDDQPISRTIVEAVAAYENTEPHELSRQLYESIEPGALDTLYRAASERDETLRIAFTFLDDEVVIVNRRRVTVREAVDNDFEGA
jgi:hypothetical protein